MEIWKDIKGYEGIYQVSNLGNIKNIKYFRDIKGYKNGYLFVILSKNSLTKTFSRQRLVAQAFIPNPENKPQVNHINGNKLDNCVENLEWNTASENMKHRFKVLGYKNKNPTLGKFGKDNPNSKKVNQYTKKGQFIKSWGSIIDIERKLKIYRASIISVCKGTQKTAGGFIWKYY